MTNFSVKVELKRDEPAGSTRLIIKRAVALSTMELKGNLQRNSPVDEGGMQGSWLISAAMPGDFESKIISTKFYTPFVNDGTGLYGPRHRKIYPKTARFLGPFKWKGRMIAVPWTRGIKPRRFVEKSINQTGKRSDEFVIRAAMEIRGDI